MRKTGNIIYVIATCFLLASCSQAPITIVDSVNPKIGANNDGSNCVIGPQLPFGSINPSPQTPNGHHDGYDPGQPIRGFGQLHVSGTGWGKYGQVFVSPQIGLSVGETEHDSPKENEIVRAYEYGVTLARYNIRTEVSPSYHSAIYRFIFPKSDESNILIDLSHNIPEHIATEIGGEITEGTITIDTVMNKISGYGNYSGGFGQGNYPVYFTAEFSRKPKNCGTWKNGIVASGSLSESISATNDGVGAYVNFSTSENDTVYMKIAVSFKSPERAKSWLADEINGFGYNEIKKRAIDAWNTALGKINIETSSEVDREMFYTAMYHAMLMPRNRSNDMRGFDDGKSVWDDQYAVWDTWRTLFPLMVLINPDMVAGNVNSFIERYKTNGMIKDAYIAGYDMAEEQGGNNVDNIIADACIKGIEGVNWNVAYRVLKFNADTNRGGWQGWGNNKISDPVMDSYKQNGWIPEGIMSCSYTLEYAYNDFCAAQVAEKLGISEDAEKYYKRSEQWENLWNSDATSEGFNGFIMPKRTDGSWVDIDIKKNWGSWKEYYYEGNAWTYSYFVPHAFDKLVHLNGGKEKYAEKLNSAMSKGLIDYSNEPAFLVAYSFIYAGRPDLASFWVRKLISEGYSLKGYPGNDDSGAMSSWYIFSSLGFFPNSGQDIYYLIGSAFPKSTINLNNGKQLIIKSDNASAENIYVQSCKVNGKEWNKAWISHEILMNGAVVHFVMGKKPSVWAQTDTSLD